MLKMQAALESFRLETPLYVLDTHHVRPGLSLTQRQYDTAKEVILDILGYGVPPEYLIDCGLSREIIYYVFTELNLRLPNNLDIVGLPPYPPPPDMIASILLSQSSYSLPSASLEDSNVVDDAAVRGSPEHLAFSPRPPAPHDPDRSFQAPAPATDEASTSASPLARSESTLAAMERQRKQNFSPEKLSKRRENAKSLRLSLSLDPLRRPQILQSQELIFLLEPLLLL
ncbi:hypothetical protein EI94DRAFT_380519 [Lactarius quietus]|nr:hypothetical protein EI94DRAFT_380519 [Lactarius quietus]